MSRPTQTALPVKGLLNLEGPKPEVWTDADTDRLLDAFLEGAHPRRLAVELNRSTKAIFRRLQALAYNERNQAENYHPKARRSREGKRFNQNEKWLIRCHQERGIPVTLTAKLLSRPIEEIPKDETSHPNHQSPI
jgi:hypothetical protein